MRWCRARQGPVRVEVLLQRSGGGDSQLGNLVATAMRLRRRVEGRLFAHQRLGIRRFRVRTSDPRAALQRLPFDNTITTLVVSLRRRGAADARLRGGAHQRAWFAARRSRSPESASRWPATAGRSASATCRVACDRLKATRRRTGLGGLCTPTTSCSVTAAASPTARSTPARAGRSTALPATRSPVNVSFRSAAPGSSCSSATPRASTPESASATRMADYIPHPGLDPQYRCNGTDQAGATSGHRPERPMRLQQRSLLAPERGSPRQPHPPAVR